MYINLGVFKVINPKLASILGHLHCVPKKTCDHIFDDKLK